MRQLATVEDTCACGSAFSASDRNIVILGFRHNDWLAAHAGCRAKRTCSLCGRGTEQKDGPCLVCVELTKPDPMRRMPG